MEITCMVIRHRKENLKKCSLRGLEKREDFEFFQYPRCTEPNAMPSLSSYILLDMEGDILSPEDRGPYLILDATWRYAATMQKQIPQLHQCRRRRIPEGWKTAYPRCQTECLDPEKGLASIEAIFVAFFVSGYPTEGILDNYYWKDEFLEKNARKLN